MNVKPRRLPTPPRAVMRGYSIRRLIRASLFDLWSLLSESRFALLGFLVLAVISTVYLRYIYEPNLGSLGEALYETLKLMTLQSGLAFPVGRPEGVVIFFLIPLLGLALIFQSVLNFGRLILDKGSRREAWQIALASTSRNHVIVCGLGRIGLGVVRRLISTGHQPVVVERFWNTEFVPEVMALKVPIVEGDASDPRVLRLAGVMRASALISAINDDLLNIEIGLTARNLRPDMRVILRVFNEDLDRNLERSFGMNTAFSASALASPTFAAATVSRDIEYAIPVSGALLGVTRIRVHPESKLNRILRTIEQEDSVRVIVHRTAEQRRLKLDLSTRVGTDDELTVIGSIPALEALRKKNASYSLWDQFSAPGATTVAATASNIVIVCGLGKVSFRVVRHLYSVRPRPRIVVVFLGEETSFERRLRRLEGVTLIAGDARDPELLARAGLPQAMAVAALTSDDLVNLQIGLTARRQRPDVHVVLRVFSNTLADRLEEIFGIRTAYSTSALSGPTLAAAALVGDVRHVFDADERLFASNRVKIDAGHALCGRSVEQLRANYGAVVLEIRHLGTVALLPPPDATLDAGDEVLLLAAVEQLARLRA